MVWKYRRCVNVDLQTLYGCFINTYANCNRLKKIWEKKKKKKKNHRVQPWFAFPGEEQKKVGSWCHRDLCHTCWSCSQTQRLYEKKRKKRRDRNKNNWMFNLWGKQSTFTVCVCWGGGGGGGRGGEVWWDQKCLVTEVIFLPNAQYHW